MYESILTKVEKLSIHNFVTHFSTSVTEIHVPDIYVDNIESIRALLPYLFYFSEFLLASFRFLP